jgi:predicted Zn-dependent peptidase
MPFHSHTLPNGLQLIGESSPSARSVAVGFFVRTGSRDETPQVCGVSHFLEHMVFKGTPRRTAFEVNRDFDRIGADYNAYTSEENTVYHAACLPEYLPQAFDILADILRPSLRQEDFDTEKKVIINEIGRYEDMPHWSAYDKVKQLHFADHTLGNSILGTPASITALKREQMLAYWEARYSASNITISIAGNFDWSAFVALAELYCAQWKSAPVGRTCLREAPGSGKFELVRREKVAQQYVVMVSPGPPAISPLRYAADMLSMAIGDDTGSRLYWELIDPGLADSADCGFHEYDGTGAFYTSISGEPDRTEENLAIVRGVLEQVQEQGITEEELTQARNKVLSRVVRSSERPKGRMFAVGANWIYQGTYRTVDDDLNAYESVTLADIRAVLDCYPLVRQTTLALGPLPELHLPGDNGQA